MHVDFAGRATLEVADPDPRLASEFGVLVDPYVPESGASREAPDVLVRVAPRRPLVEVHRRAQDGLVTGWDGAALHVFHGDKTCTVPSAGEPLDFVYERGFPLASVFRRYVRPGVQMAMWRHGAVCAHACGVVVAEDGMLVAGWSETGKTETALALMEKGARFVSDKWTILGSDARISTFPITAGIRRWVLSALPTLRSSLPWRARCQFGASAAVDAASGALRHLPARVVAGPRRLAEQAVLLADRAALTPSQLLTAYGDEPRPKVGVPLSLVVLLTTVQEKSLSARRVDPEWAAGRLAASAAHERRFFFELDARRRYSAGPTNVQAVAVEHREREFLLAALQGLPILEVRTPFPTDPRPVAELVLQEL